LKNALETQVKLLLKNQNATPKQERQQAEAPLYQLDQGKSVHVVTVNLEPDSLNTLFPLFGQDNDQYLYVLSRTCSID
jgi:hypothetical protein